MYKKKIISVLFAVLFVFSLTFTVKADIVEANDTGFEEEVQEEELSYEQTKQVLVFNDIEESTERLDFCNSVESNDLQENIQSILAEDVKKKETNAVINDASNNVTETLSSLEDEQKKQENQVGEPIYTNLDVNVDDEYLLATIIFCEAGNQSYEGKVAVGNVVLNRVASGKFPNTIKDVIYASGQFEPVSTGWFDRELTKGTVNESCLQAARDALNGVNIVGGRLYFHVPNQAEKNGETDGYILGGHIFY